MTRTALYRHYDADGQLLYVGITNDPKRRLYEHKCRAIWSDQIANVTVKWMPSRPDAEEAERQAIATESPVFNGGERVYQETGDAFKDWMALEGLSQEDIAAKFEISRTTISEILNGKRKASLRFAVFIEDISNGAVPVRYWMFGKTLQKRAVLEAAKGAA